MIFTVTPNPCVDKTVFVDELVIGGSMRSKRYTTIPGGKGTNVSRAVKALGRETKAMVIVGGHTGRHVVEMIEKQDGVTCAPAWVESPTRTITTVLENKVHRQTVFFEPGSRVALAEYESIISVFCENVRNAKIVTFNGTVCDATIASMYRDLIPIAKAANAITILDSYGREFSGGLTSVPYMVKPNVKELELWTGRTLSDEASRWEAIGKLHDLGVMLVVLSLGKGGVMVSRREGQSTEQLVAVPPAIEEINAVGSGDCLVAGFAIGLMEGQNLEAMARLGVAAGTANAMTWDIGHFDPAQIDAIARDVTITHIT